MRILVVGAGSTGGYFGGRLAQAGRDVTFLVRPARAEALRRDGLRLVSPHGDAALRPKLVTADAVDGPFDAVLLAVKSYSLDAAMADMAPAVGPATMVLPVLNGMRHVGVLRDRFGPAALAGCACKIAASLDGDGRVVQLAALHDLAYGEMDGRDSPRIRALDAAMQGAGFDARLSPDIEREMWEKWILLASLGGVTCLMRGTIGQVEAAPGGAAFILRLIDEVVRTVTAVGRTPSEAFLRGAKAALTKKGSAQTSSMYRDLEKGSPVEADAIIGDLVARAGAAGIDTPLLAAACAHLSVYQAGLASPGA